MTPGKQVEHGSGLQLVLQACVLVEKVSGCELPLVPPPPPPPMCWSSVARDGVPCNWSGVGAFCHYATRDGRVRVSNVTRASRANERFGRS